jgi:hypothetical protein
MDIIQATVWLSLDNVDSRLSAFDRRHRSLVRLVIGADRNTAGPEIAE